MSAIKVLAQISTLNLHKGEAVKKNSETMTDDIEDRIAVKEKQVQVENDPAKKERYRKQLLILRLRKEIAKVQQQLKN